MSTPARMDSEPRPKSSTRRERPEEMDFSEWLANLWEGRRVLLGFTAAFLLMGVCIAWLRTPVFQTEALIQVQGKKPGASDAAFAKIESLFAEPSEVQAEIVVLKSHRVLGRTIEALGLDIKASPKLLPVVGRALVRGKPDAPRLEVESFEVPTSLRGQPFRLVATEGGGFRLEAPDGAALGTGRPGETLQATRDVGSITLKTRSMVAQPGQVFLLQKKTMNAAIAELAGRFEASERGKMTNVLALSLKDRDPARGALTLNEIINQYIQYKLERKSGEATKTLAILHEKLPGIKAALDAAEDKLNHYRRMSGSVDLSQEAILSLQQSSSTSAQISALKQKKEELLRTYKENADVVVTLNQQIAALQGELGRVDAKVRSLPGTQQEIVRLSRDVQVNTELYTALRNNIQQLQIASAGDVGNVALLDSAAPNPDPVGPKRPMVVGLFAFTGLLAGGAFLVLRQALRSRIKDHRLIESKLGLPVVVTIPHSLAQDEQYRAILQHKEGIHLLAVLMPDDLAMESLRSLRTMLHFSMKGARNNMIMVTGPSPSVGKSFVCSNFSSVLAHTGVRVLLVDGDLRKGSLHRYFGLKTRLGGLSDVLAGRSEWKSVIHKTEVMGLDVISTGVIPPNPADLLMTERFSAFAEAACLNYDLVILDAPPLLPVTDAVIIGARAGTVFLVAKYDHHPMDELHTCQKRLESHGIQISGVVFNDVKPLGLGNGRDYRYAYHYKYK